MRHSSGDVVALLSACAWFLGVGRMMALAEVVALAGIARALVRAAVGSTQR